VLGSALDGCSLPNARYVHLVLKLAMLIGKNLDRNIHSDVTSALRFAVAIRKECWCC